MIAKAIPGEGADALAARTMAHAAVNAALAKAQGNNALAGAAGAATAEMMAPAIIASLGWDQNNLSETQKQTVSALSTLAAGLAGGLAGGSTESAVSGAQAGKTTTENNYLSQGHPQEYAAKYKACNGNAGCEQNIRKDMAKESAENIQKLKSCWDSGDAACVADTRSKIELNDKAYTELRQQDNMAGRAYEDSAKWYADIIDQCAGKCGWLEASLLKAGADGLTNIAYGALSMGSLPKYGQTAKPSNPSEPPKNTTKPVNIANDFIKNPQAIWGRSTDDIVKDFQAAGYQVNVRNSTRGSGQAVIIEIKGHPEISQIQYHPGGGRHGGSYYKVSTTTQGTMKVVDPSSYKPTPGEKSTIINKSKE